MDCLKLKCHACCITNGVALTPADAEWVAANPDKVKRYGAVYYLLPGQVREPTPCALECWKNKRNCDNRPPLCRENPTPENCAKIRQETI